MWTSLLCPPATLIRIFDFLEQSQFFTWKSLLIRVAIDQTFALTNWGGTRPGTPYWR